ncbi:MULTISPECIES: HipA N-terminal domain-containing protein [unclassified Agrobacterium]|uniref:HipA N-terminal domain-containing protein n=1 Tax=unclassified Agrobacterium TaxID=2632611 RepID=UPI00244D577E|nr:MULTISPECIES: HipA N-terminal domain-containing protein [unclassified Agrobacterium]MDH0614948.1 HipA N-terminal domain-containing protein [Agrobacterium sp. GD03872]MDH0698599.1 HipA N-terminal domain-containing protein [Agrobacterium sp. GD03871]MDH1062010.1 HipA N-terminal domain-containing protein [Agrobacterium sp. GD03992]MDH2211718.1 HipA N-terminal domain-containing protein [Agrobacterium sp. GD03643]MDH2220410.1 HipA N-terminal domain-containing protein [Agrobacterium sp. GD03638]
MSHVLDVQLRDRKVGELKEDKGRLLTFTYRGNDLARNPVALSASPTVQGERLIDRVARPFFSDLMQDESVRHRLAAALSST